MYSYAQEGMWCILFNVKKYKVSLCDKDFSFWKQSEKIYLIVCKKEISVLLSYYLPLCCRQTNARLLASCPCLLWKGTQFALKINVHLRYTVCSMCKITATCSFNNFILHITWKIIDWAECVKELKTCDFEKTFMVFK